MWVENAQHRYSTHFASMLQDKLPFFLVRFAVPLRPYLTDSFFFCVVFIRNMSCQQLSRSHFRGGSSENVLQ